MMFLSSAVQGATLSDMEKAKNAAAVALGKRRAKLAGHDGMSELGTIGGSIGGPARAAALSPKRRSEIAKKAAAARWAKKKK